jgi:hypothetical protein
MAYVQSFQSPILLHKSCRGSENIDINNNKNYTLFVLQGQVICCYPGFPTKGTKDLKQRRKNI